MEKYNARSGYHRQPTTRLIDTLFKLGTIYRSTQQGEIVPSLSVISISASRWGEHFSGAPFRQLGAYLLTLLTLAALLFAPHLFASSLLANGEHGWARPQLAVAPPLGTAASFAVLGGSTVTNIGGTVVTGDLGVSPGSAIIGFPPGVVVGTIHATDAVAAQAQADGTVAYNNLAGQACDADLTSQNLGGLTLTPGVYCFSSSAQLTGILTLDGQGDPDAVFVFQIGSTLTTASAAAVLLINSASACNVFWQLGSSATLGTGSAFAGNLLALTSITLNSTASIAGRALARNGAVTLDTNSILTSCTVVAPTATSTNTPVPTSTNTPMPTDTSTPVPTNTSTPIGTNTNTPSATSTGSITPTPNATTTATPTILPTQTNPPTGLDPVKEPVATKPAKVYLPLVSQ